jgi:hypothetical protein
MLTSKFEYLRSPNFITLCAGHGGNDSGAVSGNNVERENNIYTTERIANNLKNLGISVYVVPHELDLVGAINHVNSKFKWGQTWAIEIHRDSASGISSETADKRVGVYGFGQYTGQDGRFFNEDKSSMDIARFMRDRMVQLGSEANSWARTDNSASFGRLGWIRDTNPLAHLIELGFVQGLGTNEHLNWLSDLATIAIYEAFTGKNAPNQATPNVPEPTKVVNMVEKSIVVLRSYSDLPINIVSLEGSILKQEYDLVLDQILTIFRQQTAVLNQIKTDLMVSNQQKENYKLQLANILKLYDQLQVDFSNYKKGNLVEFVPSQAILNSTSINSNSNNLEAIEQPGIEQNNASNKPFWKSKKFGANLLSTLSSVGLILWQTSMIKPDDNLPIISSKLGTAIVGVLGLSFVAFQYIKSQGKVDEASFNGNIQQFKNSELQNFIRKNI